MIVISSACYSLVSSPLLLSTEGPRSIVVATTSSKKRQFPFHIIAIGTNALPRHIQNNHEWMQQPMSTTNHFIWCRWTLAQGWTRSHSRQTGHPYAPSRQHFEGEMEALKGHVYDLIGSKSADLFITTTNQITGFIGRTYTQGGDIHLAMENLAVPTIEGPTTPTSTDALTKTIFQEEVKEYVKWMKKLEENVQLLWAYCGDRPQTPSGPNWKHGETMMTCANTVLVSSCSMLSRTSCTTSKNSSIYH